MKKTKILTRWGQPGAEQLKEKLAARSKAAQGDKEATKTFISELAKTIASNNFKYERMSEVGKASIAARLNDWISSSPPKSIELPLLQELVFALGIYDIYSSNLLQESRTDVESHLVDDLHIDEGLAKLYGEFAGFYLAPDRQGDPAMYSERLWIYPGTDSLRCQADHFIQWEGKGKEEWTEGIKHHIFRGDVRAVEEKRGLSLATSRQDYLPRKTSEGDFLYRIVSYPNQSETMFGIFTYISFSEHNFCATPYLLKKIAYAQVKDNIIPDIKNEFSEQKSQKCVHPDDLGLTIHHR